VDFFYGLPEPIRRALLATHQDTNYAAVDLDLLQEMYQAQYERSVAGESRTRIRPGLELRDVVETADGVLLQFYDLYRERVEWMAADAVVLATGYVRPKQHPLLAQVAPYVLVESDGSYQVDRAHCLVTQPHFRPRIFLQGFSEARHGLSETLLSTLPIRACEILRALWLPEDAQEQPEERAHAQAHA
jgi:L-ornithine N5-oxygenase